MSHLPRICLVILLFAVPAQAMEGHTTGDQLILSGPVIAGDFDRIRGALDAAPQVDTVILRNSPGGDPVAGYQVGAMIRRRGLRTAVSGYCFSSCSRMFLGGKVRVFTDDYPLSETNIGFHGHYDAQGHLDAGLVQRLGLKDWIIRYFDGKADPALVERWINIPSARGMAHFYHPPDVGPHTASAFFCSGSPGERLPACEPIPRTALDLGVITSLEVIRSNDRPRPKSSRPE